MKRGRGQRQTVHSFPSDIYSLPTQQDCVLPVTQSRKNGAIFAPFRARTWFENKKFDWLSVNFFVHWLIRMLALLPFLHAIISFLHCVKEKTALFSANQNRVIFSCIFLDQKQQSKPKYVKKIWLQEHAVWTEVALLLCASVTHAVLRSTRGSRAELNSACRTERLGPVQTPNFSWTELNSNLDWPKLTKVRLLIQTSNLIRRT